jgi:hypothetical protein
VVADALSRRNWEAAPSILALSAPTFELFDNLRQAFVADQALHSLREEVERGDFIEGLPRVNGKTVLLIVVDRFSKAAHFILLHHPYTATKVACTFFDVVVRLHAIPSSIVSDRDPVFTSGFLHELLFALAGVKLNFSSAFHPQSDGQAKATNKIIGMYLCCLSGDRPRDWLRWLPWTDFATTQPISRPCALPYSGWYTDESRHWCTPTRQGRHACRWCSSRWRNATSFLWRSESVFIRPNNITRPSMMGSTVRYCSRWGSGSGCGWCTGRWRRSMSPAAARAQVL